MLTHKATLAERQVVSVFFSTWIRQTNCGICNNGIVFDMDWNVAVNIAQRANHPTSTVLPIDGRMQALVGKALSAASTSRT